MSQRSTDRKTRFIVVCSDDEPRILSRTDEELASPMPGNHKFKSDAGTGLHPDVRDSARAAVLAFVCNEERWVTEKALALKREQLRLRNGQILLNNTPAR